MAEISDAQLNLLLAQAAKRQNSARFGFVMLLIVLAWGGWWAATNLTIETLPTITTGVVPDQPIVPTLRTVPSRVPPVKPPAPAGVVQTQPTRTPTPTEDVQCDGTPFTVDADGRIWCADATPTATPLQPATEWRAPLVVPAGGIPSVCDTWHPPLPYPPECASWHAPLVKP